MVSEEAEQLRWNKKRDPGEGKLNGKSLTLNMIDNIVKIAIRSISGREFLAIHWTYIKVYY